MAKFTLKALLRQWSSAWKKRKKYPVPSLEFFQQRFEMAWKTYAQGLGTANDLLAAHDWLLSAAHEAGHSDEDILRILKARLPREKTTPPGKT